jgi:hypothetical protein
MPVSNIQGTKDRIDLVGFRQPHRKRAEEKGDANTVRKESSFKT